MEAKAWESAFDEALDLWHAGRKSQAVSFLVQLSNDYPNEWKIWAMLGAYLYDLGRLEAAVSRLERAVVLAPDAELPARTLSLAYHDQGNFEASLKELRRFQELTTSAELREEWDDLIAQVGAKVSSC